MPGYTGVRPDSCATIAQMLKSNGYNTAAFGKMHRIAAVGNVGLRAPMTVGRPATALKNSTDFSAATPTSTPPPLIDGTTTVEPPKGAEEGYRLSEDITNQAISWIRSQQAMTPDKPFFVYHSFGATHAPHHVPRSGSTNTKASWIRVGINSVKPRWRNRSG